jgi:cysteinyl-tRNA synthetase
MTAVALICFLFKFYSLSHAFCGFVNGFIGSRQCNSLRSLSREASVCKRLNCAVDDAGVCHDLISQAHELSEYYRRDPRDGDTEIADEMDLRQKLKDRFMARKERNYDVVHDIDESLKAQFGVRVYDHPNFWTTQRTAPPSHLRKRARKQMQEMKERYGPIGHPYTRVGGAIDSLLCSMDMTEIHSLLSRRTDCQMQGKDNEADAIKLELLLHGVRLDDSVQQWRADGGTEFDKVWTESIQKPLAAVHYQQNEASQDLHDEIILHRVKQLVEMRSSAIVREEALLASFFALELYKTYNVGVEDKNHTWSVGCKFLGNAHWMTPESPKEQTYISEPSFRYLPIVFDNEKEHQSPPYQPSAFSRKVPCDFTLRRITALVQERIHKREEHHFVEADAIRKELWATYYVGVNDRLHQWSVGGVF